jgi:hypothetical protein
MPSSTHMYDVAVGGGGAAVTSGVAVALHAAAGNPVPARQVQQELQKQDARLVGI